MRFRGFAEGIVLERLAVALTPVIAELIADIAEFKFLELEPDRAHELPNSSLLQAFPRQVGLDAPRRVLLLSPSDKGLTTVVAATAAAAADDRRFDATRCNEIGAEAAVAEAAGIWQELESGMFAPRLIWSTHEQTTARER